MSTFRHSERLLRPLAVVTGVLLAAGLMGAAIGVSERDDGAPEPTVAIDDTSATTVPRGDTPVGAARPGSERDAEPASTVPGGAPPLPPGGASSVPATGVHRYVVTATGDDGSEIQEEELLEVTRLSGDDVSGQVQLSLRVDGQGQTSVLEWTPQGTRVLSTRIDAPPDTSESCAWDPPFTEFGLLSADSAWTVASRCTTTIAGNPTVLEVTGSGRVVGEETVTGGEGEHRVWRIERQRSTHVTSRFGEEEVAQRVDETATILFDPLRGIAVRRDITVVRSGDVSGTTRRVAVLQP